MMVSLNLRLLPKLMKRGILGGSSKNTYLADSVRKIEMQLIFPKKHWKITEKDDFFTVELLDYTFVGTTLSANVLSYAQKIAAQELNYEKAKERLKEAKRTHRTASRLYKAAATLSLDQASVNEKRQKIILDDMKAKQKILKKPKPKVKKKKVDENGKV